MKKFLFITSLVLANTSFAKNIDGFAIVADPDGQTNVRQEPTTSAKINTVLKNGEVVDCVLDNSENNFCYAQFDKDNNGYIHQSRLVAFDQNSDMLPVKFMSQTQTSGHYQNTTANLSLDITVKPVKIVDKLYSENGHVYNGKKLYGSDGKFNGNPFQISKITVKQNGKSTTIISPLFDDAFIRDYEILEDNSYFKYNEVYFNQKTKMLYLMSRIGMGAGVYTVVFEIQNGKLVRRLIWDANL